MEVFEEAEKYFLYSELNSSYNRSDLGWCVKKKETLHFILHSLQVVAFFFTRWSHYNS